jgi:hypothetical protein
MGQYYEGKHYFLFPYEIVFFRVFLYLNKILHGLQNHKVFFMILLAPLFVPLWAFKGAFLPKKSW